jgi:hypothetical protein
MFGIVLLFIISISVSYSFLFKGKLALTQFSGFQELRSSGQSTLSPIVDFVQLQQVSGIITSIELKSIIREMRNDEIFRELIKLQYIKYWNEITTILKRETYTFEDLIGSRQVSKLLSAIDKIDVYEANTVKAFFSNPVFESMLGGILYEGIFEFLQKVDFLGNIVNKLPIIGPIRLAIMQEFKNNLDRTIGVQIKSFLATFNKVAVQRMVDFIVSPQNKVAFRSVNQNIIKYLLQRKLSTFLPNQNEQLQQQLWEWLLTLPQEDIDRIIDYVFHEIEQRTVRSLIDVSFEDLLKASPTLKMVLERNFGDFMKSAEGKAFLQALDNYRSTNGIVNE